MYNRKDYENFLTTELETQVREYERLIKTRALVLKERGEIFVGRFLKFNEKNIAIFKIKVTDNMPLANSFWTATHFVGEMGNFNNWGNNSWEDLRDNYQKDFSEAQCIWISKSLEDNKYCLVGIKKLSLTFAKTIQEETPIIAFGPQDPPLQYLLNLIDIVRDESSSAIQSILNYKKVGSSLWNPEKLKHDVSFTDLILEQLQSNNCSVVQGPPGTGKTYRMASLAAYLLREGKSVLVTALTNQALMELAEKDDIEPFLKEGRVSKTSLTVDEKKEIPLLQPNEGNVCNSANGYLSLATFFVSSGWAKYNEEPQFDFVIMDEASQAFFPMIAATLKLGKKVIWIGDQRQLAPIVKTNEDTITRFGWWDIIKGFNTLCENFTYPSYMLNETYRLLPRGAESTGGFYNNELLSVSEHKEVNSKIKIFHPLGGPSLMSFDLKDGDKTPKEAIVEVCRVINEILNENKKAKIAVLSKFRPTVRELQRTFLLFSNRNEIPENVKIDTVDSVQGLTVDYTFFVIPNASLIYSLEKELFNVATSRAKYCTVIVADNNILHNHMAEEVRQYLLKAQEDRFVSFESPRQIKVGNICISDTGRKIDLSQYEKKRKGIIPGKENVYVIDTNVFVDCPTILSKIGKDYKSIVPAKVLEELDKLKLNKDIDKKSLSDAAKNIHSAFTQSFSSMEDADVSLLPNGFDKRNPDCMILSVALKYKNERQNPILLTSDNMLQSRASGLGITTLSLKEFLKK